MILQHHHGMRCPGWRIPNCTGPYCCSFKYQSLKKQGNLPMEKLLQNQINNIEKQVIANAESTKDLGVRTNRVEQHLVRIDEHLVQIDDHLIRLDNRFDKVDERFAKVDERFAKADERFGRVEAAIAVISSNYLTSGAFHKEMRAHTAWMISCMFAIASLAVAAAKLLFTS